MSGQAHRMIHDGVLWGGAVVLVLALHLGGALWLMHQAEAAAPPGLPEAVFIDLAPPIAPTEEADSATADAPVPPSPDPDPEQAVAPLELPPLMELEPLASINDLIPPAPALDAPQEVVLDRSVRPQHRPRREPDPESRREAPPRSQQAEPHRETPPATHQQPTRHAEQGRQNAAGQTGISTRQHARDEASWKQQVAVCLLRSASRVSGARGMRGVVHLVVARNGRVQSAALGGSTGNPGVDREITRAFGRARCPAAPPSLTQAAYEFRQPFAIR